MKKAIVAFATTSAVLLGGTFATSVSAEEHEVSDQETLWGIAHNYDTSVKELKDINQLDSDVIHPGQVIETDTDSEDKSKETVYTVQKGDTLSKIALNHDMTVKELKKDNDLSSSLIIVGDKLNVQVDETEEQPQEKVQSEPEETEATEEVQEESNKEEATEENNEQEQQASEPEETEAAAEAEETDSQSSEEQSGETMTMTATAYTATCNGCSGVTATGLDLANNPNKKVIAVDPSVIPLGSKVHVEGYGEAIAADTGGAITGNKIDVHVPNDSEAANWGVQTVNVTILD